MSSQMRSLLDPEQVGWFVARQPAIVKLLSTRLQAGTDPYAVALDGAWRLASVFEYRDGVAPPRLRDPDLADAELAVARDALSGQALADGAASRQTELCRWVAAYVADPPVPLDSAEVDECARTLLTILYALDSVTAGFAAVSPPVS